MKPSIRSFKDIKNFKTKNAKLLVLFSGGLDGTYLIHWLKQAGFNDVYALTAFLGGEGDTEHSSMLAEKLNATIIRKDLRKEFAENFVVTAIQAQARYLNQHPISASLSRPLIAKTAVEVSENIGCEIIIHSATPSQNSLRRFNGACEHLNFIGHFGSPFELNPVSRIEKIKYLRHFSEGIFSDRKYSIDTNLWCREFEGGILDNVESLDIPEELFLWSKKQFNLEESKIELEFNEGILVRVNDEKIPLENLISILQYMVGKYGLGRYIALEELDNGTKFPEIREMPAAYILLDAYRHLESAILPSETIREKMILEQVWVREASEGRWYFPLHIAATQFIKELSKYINGRVTYILKENSMQLLNIQVNKPLYKINRDSHEKELLENYQSLVSNLDYSLCSVA